MRAAWALLHVLLKPLLLLAAIFLGLGLLLFPWALPIPGWTTLTGDWSGAFASSRGPAAHLFLRMELRPSMAPLWTYVAGSTRYSSPPGAPLEGHALLCTRRLGRIEMAVVGRTTARSGETLKLLLTPSDLQRQGPRFELEGRWQGAMLELIENGNNLDEALGEPGRGGNRAEDWIRLSLRKGAMAKWLTGCEAIP